MAKIVFAFVFILAIASVIQVAYVCAGGEGSLRREQCPSACSYRCSATMYRERCLFFCNYCCNKCLCVPSGTYGNREECPCYANWKTKRGTPKCP